MENVVKIHTSSHVEFSKFTKLSFLTPLQQKLALFVGESLALATVAGDLPYEASLEIAELAHEAEHLLAREVERYVYLHSKTQLEASCMFQMQMSALDDFFDACNEAGRKSNHFKVAN